MERKDSAETLPIMISHPLFLHVYCLAPRGGTDKRQLWRKQLDCACEGASDTVCSREADSTPWGQIAEEGTCPNAQILSHSEEAQVVTHILKAQLLCPIDARAREVVMLGKAR
eukprot:639146-Amphidinium_carterae.1